MTCWKSLPPAHKEHHPLFGTPYGNLNDHSLILVVRDVLALVAVRVEVEFEVDVEAFWQFVSMHQKVLPS